MSNLEKAWRKELDTFVNILANLLDDTQSYQGYHIYLCVIHTMSVVSSVVLRRQIVLTWENWQN